MAGVDDYGNKMGIPTVNGAVCITTRLYRQSAGVLRLSGLLPRGAHPRGAQPGDGSIVIGGRTGRDGLRGATFSSMEMDTATSEVAGRAVQIGTPFNEKQVRKWCCARATQGLYHAITDCGAGGLSSAVGEMAAGSARAASRWTWPCR